MAQWLNLYGVLLKQIIVLLKLAAGYTVILISYNN